MTLALDNLIIYLTFFTTHIKLAISNFVGKSFLLTGVRSLKRKKTGYTIVVNGQSPFGRALLEVVWKTIAPKQNSLNVSKSIHRTFSGSWYTKVNS